jgi:hypothetical protein
MIHVAAAQFCQNLFELSSKRMAGNLNSIPLSLMRWNVLAAVKTSIGSDLQEPDAAASPFGERSVGVPGNEDGLAAACIAIH